MPRPKIYLTEDRKIKVVSSPEQDLIAANKAIVALSEALDKVREEVEDCKGRTHSPSGYLYEVADSTLTTHAPAIEKARGG